MNLETAQLAKSGFGLRTAGGKWSGRRRGASSGTEPERNAARRPPTEARRSCGSAQYQPVTSARFAEWNRFGREGARADRNPVERSKPRVGHGRLTLRRIGDVPSPDRPGGVKLTVGNFPRFRCFWRIYIDNIVLHHFMSIHFNNRSKVFEGLAIFPENLPQ